MTFIFFYNVRNLFKTILCINFLYIIDSIIDSSTQKDCMDAVHMKTYPHGGKISHESVLVLEDLYEAATHTGVLLGDVGVQALSEDTVHWL